MGAIGHDGLAVPGKVVLAHEPPFTVGSLSVEPATRQVRSAANSETLEPRVMEVLVALFRAERIVTRDELTQRCWDGRVVGEDAINRVISRIRAVASGIGGGSFSVETITKVGYRLSGLPRASSDEAKRTGKRLDRRMLLGGAAALAAAGAFGWFRISEPRDDAMAHARSLRDRALALRQTYDLDDNRQAIAFLQEAVHVAPDYGEAWGTLALAYNRALIDERPDGIGGFRERMNEAVRNAERFDPGNADADSVRSFGNPATGGRMEVELRARKFISRHPQHSAGHDVLGNVLMNTGRWHEALPELLAVKRLDEFDPLARYQLAIAFWASGQISRADDEINEAARRWPQHSAISQTRIKLLALTGRPQMALAIARDPQAQPLEDARYSTDRLAFLNALVTRSPEDIDRAVDALLRRVRTNVYDSISQGLNCVALGRIDVGLSLLEGAYLKIGEWAWPKLRDNISTHPLFQPHARPLWGLPRYAAILEGAGLESYWRESNSMPDFRRG